MSVKLAVVGCGHWGSNLVRSFHDLGALGAVSDIDEDIAMRTAAAYGVSARTWDEILAADDLTAVAIAAPAAQHAGLAMDALKSRKDVFVEKPLALSISDGEALCATATSMRRILMVGHLLQYHPAFIQLQHFVAEGNLGALQYIYSSRLNLGRFRREENIWWSFAPHDISMMLRLVGDEPVSVTAAGASFLRGDIADVTTTNLRFANGVAGHVFVSWLHPYKEQKLVVVGERAMAVFDDTASWNEKLALYSHGVDWSSGGPQPVRAEPEYVPVTATEPLVLECRHFLDCVTRRSRPRTDGTEGLRVLRVLARAQSSMTGVDRPNPAPAIHATAIVDTGAEVGNDTTIWQFSHILGGAIIGERCNIGQNVVIGPNVRIGAGCRIQDNVCLYEGVEVEDDVFLGPSCVFTNVATPRAFLSRRDEFRRTLVRQGSSIGANATIVCGNEIGPYAMVGAGAVVTHDVGAHSLVVGVPARQVGWVSHSGEVLGPDLICTRTQTKYEIQDGRLTVAGTA